MRPAFGTERGETEFFTSHGSTEADGFDDVVIQDWRSNFGSAFGAAHQALVEVMPAGIDVRVPAESVVRALFHDQHV